MIVYKPLARSRFMKNIGVWLYISTEVVDLSLCCQAPLTEVGILVEPSGGDKPKWLHVLLRLHGRLGIN